ncbi:MULTISPECIES: peroxiredoxin [unclassified Sphingobium]|uniref:peroxiredoxin n=1 Tax=unclassified Sphingobium TaxID=2611147 RepID=UPI000971541C|nr:MULTISPECIES: peroxiredoxin [unclassified Sphingobium]
MTAEIPAPTSRPLRMGDPAPDFEARTTKGPTRLSDYRGRWLVFFSHPADFTPVCTTEFVALAKAQQQFEQMDCALLALSVDSLYSHLAWTKAIHELFDVEIGFPIVEDPSMAIGRAYGMLDDAAHDSSAVRATYFIDPDGVIQAITHYPMTVGRSVDEMVRMVAALQIVRDGDQLAPEGWRQGQPTLRPASNSPDGADWFCRASS